MAPADLLRDLDPAQRAAVTDPRHPLLIIAGAGSGKTRVLTHRIAHQVATGNADGRRVLALTFTRRAAGELIERLRRLGVDPALTAGTFHAVAYRQLRQRWADAGRPARSVVERRWRLVQAAAEGAGPDATYELASALDWAAPRGLTPDDYPAAAAAAGRLGDHERVASLLAGYEQEKRRRGVVDLDDLLRLCAEALEADPSFAEAQRWRFQHLFVDEFQDVNPLQFRLLRAWLGDRADMCAVGDPRQAIYGWNGADPTLLHRFSSLFPGAAVVELDHNHRSSPQVVAAAAAVLGEPAATATSPEGPRPTLTEYGTADEEATGIATRLGAANRAGVPWNRMAVLTRTNAQLGVLVAALGSAGIPTERRGPGTDVDPGGLEIVSADAFHAPPLDEDGAVTVTTFHRAKGLEWDVVCVCGLEDGLVPISHAADRAARDEERRLLHVAVTRARRELHCSWASTRDFGRGPADRQPSPWLAALEAVADRVGPPPSKAAGETLERIRGLRRMLGTRP